ncbi:MAG: CvpA family protein [Chloroflexi bacterium]|nr:CvpA family protein [Chloroflexota bacterium]
MNWVDGVIIIVALIAAFSGLRQGLIMAVFGLLGLIAGVAFAGWASDPLAGRISSDGAEWAHVLAFIIILVIVMVAFHIAGMIIKQFVKLIMLGWVDSLGGAMLGLFVGSLLATAVLIAVGKWAARVGATGVEEAIGNSPLAELLMDSFRFLLLLLPGRFEVVRDFFA